MIYFNKKVNDLLNKPLYNLIIINSFLPHSLMLVRQLFIYNDLVRYKGLEGKMSLDDVILTEVKKYILAFWTLFEGLVIKTTLEGFLSNPFIYLIAFYIGFILTWYLIGFKFGKLKGGFSIFSFIGDIFISIYFGALFSLSGFIAGIILSLLVIDIVKLILPRLGYDYSNLTTKKIIIYFWIIPFIIKIIKNKIEYRKLQKEKNI